jgi:L-arabinonolactonase
MTVELVADAQAQLGECALWCERSQSLFWTDIECCTVSRWCEGDGQIRTWTLPERVGSFALCEQGDRLLLGLASGVALFDLASSAMSPKVSVDLPGPETRVNDGRCDPQGRFVFGLFNGARDNAPFCPFYRVSATLEIERLPLPEVCVANSIAFSPDGTLMYFADSWSREIQCVEYHPDGRIGEPRRFVRLPESQGFPDGSTVDADGGLWSAQWEGGCLVRYGTDGVESSRLPLPASRVTCPAFGGAGLGRLFATTARIGLGPAAILAQPTAGGVFAALTRWHGLPEHRFATHLQP